MQHTAPPLKTLHCPSLPYLYPYKPRNVSKLYNYSSVLSAYLPVSVPSISDCNIRAFLWDQQWQATRWGILSVSLWNFSSCILGNAANDTLEERNPRALLIATFSHTILPPTTDLTKKSNPCSFSTKARKTTLPQFLQFSPEPTV